MFLALQSSHSVQALMDNDRNRLVCCQNLVLHAETDKALLVGPNDSRRATQIGRAWIPAVFISHNTFDGVGSVGEIEIPWWVADQKELAYVE